jgi:hypothetical protein
MKKTYIIPAIFAVELGTCKMMAESVVINTTYESTNPDTYIGSSEQILTKENKSIWDEEW